MGFFLRTQRVRNSRGTRVISVRASSLAGYFYSASTNFISSKQLNQSEDQVAFFSEIQRSQSHLA